MIFLFPSVTLNSKASPAQKLHSIVCKCCYVVSLNQWLTHADRLRWVLLVNDGALEGLLSGPTLRQLLVTRDIQVD
jgi:hypothetical protein